MGIFDRKDDIPKEKADFSNVQSGSSSTAPAPAVPIDSPAPSTGRTYVVVKDDSVSKIAKREYGDAGKWRRIYEANQDVIKDPDLSYPGQTRKIPGA